MDERTHERTDEPTNEQANVAHLPVWLSPDDAAEALGCSVRQLQKLHKRDPQRWPRKRVGRQSLYLVRRTDERTTVRASVETGEQANGVRPESNGHHEPLASPAPAIASPAVASAHAASMNLADQVERLARMVGRLEVELEQSRAELRLHQTGAGLSTSADVDLEAIRSEIAALIAQRNAAEHHAQAAERKAEAYGRRSGAIVRFVRSRFGRDVADEVLAAGRED